MVSMPQLRTLMESLGHTDVTTYIQSGNVIFTSEKAVTPKSLEAAIAGTFQLEIAVMLRTPAQLDGVLKANPFARADPSTVHVGFLTAKPPASAVAKLDTERFLPERFAIKGTELFLLLPNGMGRTKLPGYLDRQLKIPMTVRTWKTATKLADLAR
jgi:uncharacterized protein (DUF1697 family)